MKDDKLYLIHIGECIDRIVEYTAAGKDTFFKDIKTQDAVIRNLQTLGESIKRVSDGVKASHPEIEWKHIAGFRNVLVHDYLGVNLKRVWEVIEKFLPDLKRKIEALKTELGA